MDDSDLRRCEEMLAHLKQAFTLERDSYPDDPTERGYWDTDIKAVEGVLAGITTLRHRRILREFNK